MAAADPIASHIEQDPTRPGPSNARLRDSGVHVWAPIGHYQATGRDAAHTAESYEVPLDGVRAALAYYQQHQAAIDARLAANADVTGVQID